MFSGKLNPSADAGGIMSGLLHKRTSDRNDHFVDVTSYMQVFRDTGQVVLIEVHAFCFSNVPSSLLTLDGGWYIFYCQIVIKNICMSKKNLTLITSWPLFRC